MTQEPKQLALFGAGEGVKKAKRAAKPDDYDAFVEKFKRKKTTDDCYTPPEVYDTVLRFVGEIADLRGRDIVRPFYPGGDYERHAYPERCVVVDNPPFSIYSKIVRFYLANGIDFFLFAPHLTAFVRDADCSYVLCDATITYENGAVVNTSFVTTLLPDTRIWLCPDLARRIDAAQAKPKPPAVEGKSYPPHVLLSGHTGRLLVRGIEMKVPKSECVYQRNLDSLRRRDMGVFGGCFLLSERAAAERAAAERAAAERAAERAAAAKVLLSERELRIIRELSQGHEEADSPTA